MKYYDIGIWNVRDLRFDLNNMESYELIAKDVKKKTNFLGWISMRHSIAPKLNLSIAMITQLLTLIAYLSSKINNGVFDITIRKSKGYYSLLIKKVSFPNCAPIVKIDFNLSNKELKQAFFLPRSVAFEPCVKAIQFKVLNSVLFTNSKLFKTGYRTDNLCSFCKQKSEMINHFFWDCPYSNSFREKFKLHYSVIRKQEVHLTLKDVLICILSPESPLLNYLTLAGKFIYGAAEGI